MRTNVVVRVGLTIAAGVLLAACGSTALGYESPPASLDPNSPKQSAIDIAFDRDEITVPANTAGILIFENRENVTHNVSIYRDAALQFRVFEGVLFNGPATRWYPVPALAPGSYVFVCDLHPIMKGTLRAT